MSGTEITAKRLYGLAGYYAKERKNAPPCIAYKENGNICKAPALYLDKKRGGMICFKHETERIQMERLK